MKPGLHYLLVEGKISNLRKCLDWARDNEEEACRIAWNGYLVAKDYINNIENHFCNVITKKGILF